MKKFVSALLCVCIIFAFVGCSKAQEPLNKKENSASTTNVQVENQKMETILDPNEYILLQNIFYNDQANDYVDKDTTKKGIFSVLDDQFNNKTRYYVWGYNDNTKCCDWQWEFVPTDASKLPTVGSTIVVSGKFVANEDALDKYWIENATVEIVSQYKGLDVDVDTTTMGGTLERVQVMNIQGNKEKYEGKTISVYGRAEGPNSVQHPYYDNCFSQQFETSDPVVPTGTKIVVQGTCVDGVLKDASLNTSNDF